MDAPSDMQQQLWNEATKLRRSYASASDWKQKRDIHDRLVTVLLLIEPETTQFATRRKEVNPA